MVEGEESAASVSGAVWVSVMVYVSVVVLSSAVTFTAMIELVPTAGTASAADAVPLATAAAAAASCLTVIELAVEELAVGVTVTDGVPKGTATEYDVVPDANAGFSAPWLTTSAESVASVAAARLTVIV